MGLLAARRTPGGDSWQRRVNPQGRGDGATEQRDCQAQREHDFLKEAVNWAATHPDDAGNAMSEQALGADLSAGLGYPPRNSLPEETPNLINGKSAKTVLTEDGPLHLGATRPGELLRAHPDFRARTARHRL